MQCEDSTPTPDIVDNSKQIEEYQKKEMEKITKEIFDIDVNAVSFQDEFLQDMLQSQEEEEKKEAESQDVDFDLIFKDLQADLDK